MPKEKTRRTSSPSTNEAGTISLLSEIAHLLEVLVRLNVQAMRKDRNQKEMVLLLAAIGCGHKEIADLLGITPNSVGPALSRANRKRK